jgi:ribonuclease Z
MRISRSLLLVAGIAIGIFLIINVSSKNGESGPTDPNDVSTKARDRNVYFPNSEDLHPDEMRIISLGTGMPYGRRAQAATSWLVELGNGDKFLFDVGTGSVANLGSLEIPYDFLNKVFISHLHSDHMGDLPALYVGGVVGGRTLPFHVWGPTGSEERLGTAYAMEHLQKYLSWDLEGRKGRLPSQAFDMDVHEFDFKQENQIVYEENGVVIRSWPAIHSLDGSVSYGLEWNGFKFVFGGDTYPNAWMDEFAKNADVVIHECMMSAETAITDMNFPPGRALEVMTQIHTAPEAFGKVMSSLQPRMAIAYHFFADFNILPGINDGIRRTYDGPLSLATDNMVWNVTKEEIRVRNIAPIDEAWPARTPFPIPPMDQSDMKDVSDEIKSNTFDVTTENQMIFDRVNEAYGTEFVPRMK